MVISVTMTALDNDGEGIEFEIEGWDKAIDTGDFEIIVAEGGELRGGDSDKAAFDMVGFGDVKSGVCSTDCANDGEELL